MSDQLACDKQQPNLSDDCENAPQFETWLKDKNQEQGMGDRHSPFWRTMISHIVEPTLSSSTVLDFGCNTGNFLKMLYARKPFQQGYGVDLASASIDAANANRGELPLEYRACSKLDFVKGKIDIAFSYEVLFLLEDLNEHARQINASLRNNGVYYAATGCHTGNPLWNRWDSLIRGDSALIPHHYTLDDYADAFQKEGFTIQARRLRHQEFLHCRLHPEYFPTIESTIDYYDRDIMLFRFVKSAS